MLCPTVMYFLLKHQTKIQKQFKNYKTSKKKNMVMEFFLFFLFFSFSLLLGVSMCSMLDSPPCNTLAQYCLNSERVKNSVVNWTFNKHFYFIYFQIFNSIYNYRINWAILWFLISLRMLKLHKVIHFTSNYIIILCYILFSFMFCDL